MEHAFKGFSQQTVDFLFALKINNYKSWFEENRSTFEDYVKQPMSDLVDALAPTMLKIDPLVMTNPKKIISRIYRDVRFSKDKTPYRDHLWFSFRRPAKEWQNAPGYYFEITPFEYSFGMGYYMADKDTMDKFRNFIELQPMVFDELLKVYENQDIFELSGERYKRTLNKNIPEKHQEWYQLKSFYFHCTRGVDDLLFSPDLVDFIERGFKLL